MARGKVILPVSSGYVVPEKRGNRMRSYSYKNDMEFLEMAEEYIVSDYIKKCLFSSLEWYMVTYHKYRFRYYVISMISLIFPTMVIVLNDIQDFQNLRVICKIAISIVSAIIAIASGLGSLYKWHEKSVVYRSCAEQIKCEAVYYMAEIGNYSEPDLRDKNFLEKLERILLKENKGWSQMELKKQQADYEETDCEEITYEEADCGETETNIATEQEGEEKYGRK